MSKASELGKTGEELAAEYLARKGYTIRHVNWNLHKGYELDIVAEIDGEIVFVEVKTRRPGSVQRPEDAVDSKKIRHICRAADLYVREFGIDMFYRFDIISILCKDENDFELEHFPNAFGLPLSAR